MQAIQTFQVNGETLLRTEDSTLVQSHTDPTIWYELSWSEGHRCSCLGYSYRGSCRHSAAVRASFSSSVVVPEVDESTLNELAPVAGGAPEHMASRHAKYLPIGAQSHGVDDGEYQSYTEWRERKLGDAGSYREDC